MGAVVAFTDITASSFVGRQQLEDGASVSGGGIATSSLLYLVLPVIMAGAMFVQYKLNPAPPDPIQAKVFMILPLVMSVTFAFFPSGLVLYWVTNNVLTLAAVPWILAHGGEAYAARWPGFTALERPTTEGWRPAAQGSRSSGMSALASWSSIGLPVESSQPETSQPSPFR